MSIELQITVLVGLGGIIAGFYAAGLVMRYMINRKGYKLATPQEMEAASKYQSLQCPICGDNGYLVITERQQRCVECDWIGAAAK